MRRRRVADEIVEMRANERADGISVKFAPSTLLGEDRCRIIAGVAEDQEVVAVGGDPAGGVGE